MDAMKAAVICFLIGCRIVCGQQASQAQQPESKHEEQDSHRRLRVSLDIKLPQGYIFRSADPQRAANLLVQLSDVLTAEFSRLGDVEPNASNNPDEKLHILIEVGDKTGQDLVIFLMHTRPDGNREILISAVILGPTRDDWVKICARFRPSSPGSRSNAVI